MDMISRLKDAFFDPTNHTIHWVHTAAEIVEAAEATLAIIASAETGAIAIKAGHWLHKLESIGAAEGSALYGVLFPAAIGVVAMLAEFAAIGMGYHDAAEKLLKKPLCGVTASEW